VNILTEVDELAERIIREILLGQAFPTYGMLAEDGGLQVRRMPTGSCTR
jgi:fructose-1,6-bisphosphatase/inositol monophosphatase family enzyme